jgi:TetR/AcrR family transcriptional repressor of mexJK operon
MAERPKIGRPTRAEAAVLEDRLRRAAIDTFLANGFDGTTMEAVAAAAGITKRTLYAKYPDKRALFAAVVPWALSTMRWGELPQPDTTGDLRATLIKLGRNAIARVVDPQVVQLTRIAMSTTDEFPQFAEAAQSMTWSPRHRAVAAVLEHHAQLGTIEVDDVEFAAEQFLAMVSGFPAMLALFGLRRSGRDEERRLKHAVDLFLSGLLVR